MRKKDQRTLDAIFAKRVDGNIEWRAVEALFRALGSKIRQKSGSTIVVILKGERDVYDRPHPRPECGRGLVKRVRAFLTRAGVKP